MTIREAGPQDLPGLLALYTHLHDNPAPEVDEQLAELWRAICGDPNHHILLGWEDGVPVSSCVLVIIPNLTRSQRPYALIENVVTHPGFRGRGYASRILDCARALAVGKRCYKIMLMTGSKKQETLRFYEREGYNRQDKTAFIQWLE